MSALTPQQRRLFEAVEGRARRTELLAALQGGGVPPDGAARVLAAELTDLAADADGADLASLGAFARAAAGIVERLAGAQPPERRCDILVLDDDEVTRDLIALAIQSQGHTVRVADNMAAFLALYRERRPDVILTEGSIPNAPADEFCRFLRRQIASEVPIVMFAGASGHELAMLALNAGADRYLSKDQGIDGLVGELARLIDEIVW